MKQTSSYLGPTSCIPGFLKTGPKIMSSVLLLYTQADQHRSQELKDFLKTKLGSLASVITARDVLGNDSTVEDELFQSTCILIVYTQDSEKHLQEGAFDFDAEYVVFDGSIIKAFLEEEEVVHRVVAVHYGWRPEKWLYDRLPKRIFHVSETLELESNPKVSQIVDTIKGIVKKKK